MGEGSRNFDGRSRADVALGRGHSARHIGTDAVTRAALLSREREIARLSRLYAALSQVSQAIVCAPTRDELFQKVCQVLVEQGGFCMAWIGWHASDAQLLVPIAAWGDDTGYLQGVEVCTDQRPHGYGPSGTSFREERPYVCNDVMFDPGSLPWRSEFAERGFHSSAAFPIRDNGKVSGMLSVYAKEAGYFQDKEITLLAEAAADISFALESLTRDAARRQAERTLRQERDFSNAVLNSLPGVFYMYDQRGKFLRWNQNFERASGYTSTEIARLHPLDFFPEPDRERVGVGIEQVFREGEATVEAGLLAKDGSVAPYQFTGVMTQIDGRTCLVGVGIDIESRNRAEEERRTSEARYRTLFDYAPDGIVIADAKNRYIDANASMCRMLGYTHDELVGLHASEIAVPAEDEPISAALRVIQAKSDYSREWQFQRKDASVFPAEVIATAMPGGHFLGMVRDVTERKRAEKALRELNETLELKVAERTEELRAALVRAEAADQIKSAFLATMSHELRTPLNSIIGFTGIVLQGMAGPLTAEQTKQLGMVRGSARHLLELINDVLDLSKIEAQQLEVHAEPFDLSAALERVAASALPLAAQKGLALTVILPALPVQMLSDRRRVEQIALNLLSNAIKFTLHGTVTFRVELLDELRAPEAALAPGPAVRLRVSDTGMGVKVEDLAALFQPFRQIDSGLARGHEGTGLGLAICRRLTLLLGGEIVATSEWSKGSEFTVTLPLTRAVT